MRRSNLSVVLYLMLVFVSGAVVGGFGHRLYTTNAVSASGRPSREELRKRYMKEMEDRLNLSPEQGQKLAGILEQTDLRYREARQKMEPEMKVIEDDRRGQIRSMLDERQRAEYEKLLLERDQRRREAKKGPSGGGC